MNKTKKIYGIINIILLLLSFACLFYYDYKGGLALKGITSSCFVIIGLANLIYAYQAGSRKKGFVWLLFIALLFTMIADVMLGIHFIFGIVLFASGHVFYFASYCVLDKFQIRDLIFIVITGLLSLILVFATPFIHVSESGLKYLLGVYAVIISCMLGKSIANSVKLRSRTGYLLLVGSVLFWFSDLMLALHLFGDGGHLASMLCLYTYWPGQYLLAHTLYYFIGDGGI